MKITPRPTPLGEVPVERERTRATYDWDFVVPGQWQRWLDLTDADLTDAEAMRACTRIRVAAKWHADRNNYRLESRRQDKGRILDLRFTRREPHVER